METRVCDARSGTIWTWRAAAGRLGKSNSASCVEYMIRIMNGNGIGGGAFVDDGEIGCTKMGGTAGVGYDIGGGRTYRSR